MKKGIEASIELISLLVLSCIGNASWISLKKEFFSEDSEEEDEESSECCP